PVGDYGSSPSDNLTLRAGLGYRPVLTDGMATDIDWAAIEGIHFRAGGHIHGRIGRLVNCSFDKIPDYGFRTWHPVINSTVAGRMTEIVNCLIPGHAAQILLAGHTKLISRNSLLGLLTLTVPNEGDPELKMERCLVWSQLGPAFRP